MLNVCFAQSVQVMFDGNGGTLAPTIAFRNCWDAAAVNGCPVRDWMLFSDCATQSVLVDVLQGNVNLLVREHKRCHSLLQAYHTQDDCIHAL